MVNDLGQNHPVELDSFIHEGYGYNEHVDQGWKEILEENSLRYDKQRGGEVLSVEKRTQNKQQQKTSARSP